MNTVKNLLKITIVTLFIVTTAKGVFAQALVKPDGIIGVFTNPDGDRKMEIYKNNGQYFGKTMGAANAEVKAGTIVLKDFIYANRKWEGKIYVPEKNKEFNATLELTNPQTLKIKVKVGIISKTKIWTRVR